VQQIVGKWQFGAVWNYLTGAPLSFSNGNVNTISTVCGKPNVVGSIPKDGAR
jgi:hypothetical protein